MLTSDCFDLIYKRNIFLLAFCHQASKLSNAQVRKKRNEIFEQEKARQQSHIRRIEKIQVDHKGAPEECRLIMNKGLSTPFNCAMRK